MGCKDTDFFLTSKFFCNIFTKFLKLFSTKNYKILKTRDLYKSVFFLGFYHYFCDSVKPGKRSRVKPGMTLKRNRQN